MRKRERVPDVKLSPPITHPRRRHTKQHQHVFSRAIEPLEARRMLAVSVGVFDPVNVPVNLPTTTDLTDVKAGPLANAGQDLISLYRDFRRFVNGGRSEADFDSASNKNLLIQDGKVAVSVRGRDGAAALSSLLQSHGSSIIAASEKYSVVEAYVPISRLRFVSADASVAAMNPLIRGGTNQQGLANNQAEETMFADQVKTIYGLDGGGLKIGIISDSVDAVGRGIGGSVSSGDLPDDGIEVLSDDPTGTDEGRAMAELIHDIAPGAKLAFATNGVSQLTMAQAIRDLRAAGCDIIVDDVFFQTEPVFQPGVIDQAITEVVASGAIYLTAAGNSAASGFEDVTRWLSVGNSQLIDFDPSSAVDTRMEITTNGNFTLQWDNPYNGAVGNATADLDVYFYHPVYRTRLLYSVTTNNRKTGVPIEQIDLPAGTYELEIRLNGLSAGQQRPTRYKFFVPDELGLTNVEFSGQLRSGMFGHPSNPSAISVGAVPFFNLPPYLPNTQINSESFSSYGPTTQVFDAEGARLPSPRTMQKPDISGVDDVNTSFFGEDLFDDPSEPPVFDADLHPNFSGTSAAAPNVAAVVALLKQAAPNATQDQILNALQSTARPLNGATTGQYEAQGGFGLVDALAAVRQFITKPSVRFSPSNPSVNYGPISRLKIVFSQQVNGFDVSDLSLSVDGGPNLLTGDNEPQTVDGGRTWYVRSLGNVTLTPGLYTIELTDSDASIVNALGLTLSAPAEQSMKIFPPPTVPDAPSNLVGSALSNSTVRLQWNDNSDAESNFIVERAEDQDFKSSFKQFKLPGDTTVFNDATLPAGGRTLFYRVKAINIRGASSEYSNTVKVPSLTTGEVILDNDSPGVTRTGTWAVRSSGSGFFGSNYLDDGDAGKGSRAVKYLPTIQAAGEYYVYARWVRSNSNASNVPIDISSDGSKRKTVTVNQRRSGGEGWVLLGKFSFIKGKKGYVQIRNAGTDGHVVADAIRFLPAQGSEVTTSSKK